jgi:predicted SAM-dependent methyltransferase
VRLQSRARHFVRRILRAVTGHGNAALADLRDDALPVFRTGGSPQDVDRTRKVLADAYLRGAGIEVGALHRPLKVPPTAHVKYVDRMCVADLRRHYAELAHEPLVDTDIIDDGERLTTLGDRTQDFVIANHFLEHCQNPIQTLQNHIRVLKSGGVLYLAVPDKRFTFDIDRPCTTNEHIVRDFLDGPAWSKRQHFEEWTRLVNKRDGAEAEQEVAHLLDIDYSIHFHVWNATQLMEFVVGAQRFVQFELELFLRNGFENLLIFRKM